MFEWWLLSLHLMNLNLIYEICETREPLQAVVYVSKVQYDSQGAVLA